jgi:hypothetical protein
MKKLPDRKEIENMHDDKLAREVMYWARVARNENGLKADERRYLREILAEFGKRQRNQ